MATNTLITEQDVRAMVRLLGEVAANPGGHAAKKRQLMGGLCRLVDADAFLWAIAPSAPEADKPPVYVPTQTGGLSSEQLSRLEKMLQHPAMIAVNTRFFKELAEKRTHLTRLQRQVDPEGNLMKGSVADLIRATGLGPIMGSFRPLAEGRISAISIYRWRNRPQFSAREARIAHVVLTEVPWLHLAGWSETNVTRLPTLSSRPRAVLNMIVFGQSRKEIAASLKISPHTVDEYMKTVFRHFGVHSKSELVSRLLHGDGGDTP